MDNAHKQWEFIRPLVDQGQADYHTTVEELYKISKYFGDTYDSKNIFFNKKILRDKGFMVDETTQKPGHLIVTCGAMHQGYGWVSRCFSLFCS